MGSAQKPSQGNVVSAAHTPRTQQTWPPPGLGAVIVTPPASATVATACCQLPATASWSGVPPILSKTQLNCEARVH